MARPKIDPDHVHCEHVAQLEADIRALKRRLAERGDPLDRMEGKVKRGGRSEDWLDDLADQDRRFFERKLGMKKG